MKGRGMYPFKKTEHLEHANFFKALGHPTRLWIVKQLGDNKEHCVCEFVDAVGVDFSTISQHLSVLKQSGIVLADKRGKSVYYRLICPCLIEMLACIEKK